MNKADASSFCNIFKWDLRKRDFFRFSLSRERKGSFLDDFLWLLHLLPGINAPATNGKEQDHREGIPECATDGFIILLGFNFQFGAQVIRVQI